jgi:SAM-dependent methyltransferase
MNHQGIDGERMKTDLVRAYQQDAQRRDTGEQQTWKIGIRTRFLERLIQQGGSTLLEIGAGPGKDSLFFQDGGLRVVSSDLTPAMAVLCRKKDLDTCVADLYRLPFPADHFDAVWSMNCLLHVPQAELPEVLEGIRWVLRPGGLFHFGVYGGIKLEEIFKKDPLSPRRFFSFLTDEHIQSLAVRHFRVVSFETILLPRDELGLHFQSLVLQRK